MSLATRRRRAVRINAILQARMVKMLLYESVSAHDIAEETGLHVTTVSRYLRELHRAKVIHVIDWEKDSRGRDVTAVWRLGRNKPDKPRHRMTQAERQAAYRARMAERDRLRMMAGATVGVADGT